MRPVRSRFMVVQKNTRRLKQAHQANQPKPETIQRWWWNSLSSETSPNEAKTKEIMENNERQISLEKFLAQESKKQTETEFQLIKQSTHTSTMIIKNVFSNQNCEDIWVTTTPDPKNSNFLYVFPSSQWQKYNKVRVNHKTEFDQSNNQRGNNKVNQSSMRFARAHWIFSSTMTGSFFVDKVISNSIEKCTFSLDVNP